MSDQPWPEDGISMEYGRKPARRRRAMSGRPTSGRIPRPPSHQTKSVPPPPARSSRATRARAVPSISAPY